MTSRACVFINSNDPRVRNKLINTISCIKPQFPPNINLRELITKQNFDDKKSSGRSPNAFIIYRKAYVEAARKDGYQLPMTVVSSMASKSWDLEPEFVKDEYKRLAKEANTIRNKLSPRNKKRRQQWNIVSFPPPPTNPSTNNKTNSTKTTSHKTISKKKKVETKEISTPTNFIPPITFHIPYDICSKIEDRHKPFDNSTIDKPYFTTDSVQEEGFNFNDFNHFNNYNNYSPQIEIQSHNQDSEQIGDTLNVAVDILDLNNEFIYDFSTEHGVYYWDEY